jgi:hypothetical protein
MKKSPVRPRSSYSGQPLQPLDDSALRDVSGGITTTRDISTGQSSGKRQHGTVDF